MQNNDQEKTGRVYYKCTSCGMMHDGKDGAPKNCEKCDNDKFCKVIKP